MKIIILLSIFGGLFVGGYAIASSFNLNKRLITAIKLCTFLYAFLKIQL